MCAAPGARLSRRLRPLRGLCCWFKGPRSGGGGCATHSHTVTQSHSHTVTHRQRCTHTRTRPGGAPRGLSGAERGRAPVSRLLSSECFFLFI